jgi:LysM repeat protein
MARTAGRILALLALLATAGAIYLVVHAHIHSGGPGSTTPATTTPQHLTQGTRLPTTTHTKHRKFYVVRAGNTLSGIAAKTGVSVATIQHLNPGLNPSALQTGQRLRLRR